jgi:aldose 1-epimerase
VNGYSFRIWDHKIEDDKLFLSLYSPDGDEGFPGGLWVYVTYSFSDDYKLKIDYRAVAEADTIVNLTNHVYFNLDGCGDITEQIMQIAADSYTEIDDHFMVTGKILPVEGSPFDFRTPKLIGKDLHSSNEQIIYGLGYDHNFILTRGVDCACAQSNKTGIILRLSTDCPGLQMYTGNSLPDRLGKGQVPTSRFAGFCLETQYYPDSPNHPEFPSIVVKAGEEWNHYAEFTFCVME